MSPFVPMHAGVRNYQIFVRILTKLLRSSNTSRRRSIYCLNPSQQTWYRRFRFQLFHNWFWKMTSNSLTVHLALSVIWNERRDLSSVPPWSEEHWNHPRTKIRRMYLKSPVGRRDGCYNYRQSFFNKYYYRQPKICRGCTQRYRHKRFSVRTCFNRHGISWAGGSC